MWTRAVVYDGRNREKEEEKREFVMCVDGGCEQIRWFMMVGIEKRKKKKSMWCAWMVDMNKGGGLS